ncbi:MAG: SEL1-like repeat protein [Magnetococcales bacterium]|nr:SEL1-like repeat protein [Magnetococcales bacterium]
MNLSIIYSAIIAKLFICSFFFHANTALGEQREFLKMNGQYILFTEGVRLAESGNAEAQYQLGKSLYLELDGRGDMSTCRYWLRKAAQQGHLMAMDYLGFTYIRPILDADLVADGLPWIQEAVSRGSWRSMIHLAILYRMGWGVEQNIEKSQQMENQALLVGKESAAYILGSEYYYGHSLPTDKEQGMSLIRQAAEGEDADAQYFMGLHDTGDNVLPFDIRKSLVWMEKAARNGHAAAAEKIGKKYLQGFDLPRNMVKAKAWYEYALQKGSLSSCRLLARLNWRGISGKHLNHDIVLQKTLQCLLEKPSYDNLELEIGTLYYHGHFKVPSNPVRAFYWFNKSREKGYPAGHVMADGLSLYGQGTVQETANALFRLRTAAESGHAQAATILGWAYSDGVVGVEKDTREAKKWLTKAVDMKDGVSAFRLAYLEMAQVEKPVDWKNVSRLVRLGVRFGDEESLCLHGILRLAGIQSRPNTGLAMHFMRKGADAGSKTCALILGDLYRLGKHGVRTNPVKARQWLEVAAYRLEAAAGIRLSLLHLGIGSGAEESTRPVAAYRWLRRFAARNSPEAAYLTGLLLAGGIGTRQNLEKARLFLETARQGGIQSAENVLKLVATNPASLNVRQELTTFAATVPDHVPPENRTENKLNPEKNRENGSEDKINNNENNELSDEGSAEDELDEYEEHADFLDFLRQPAFQDFFSGQVIKRLTNPYRDRDW